MNILIYFYTLVPLAIIDGIWLFLMGGQYKKWLGHLFGSSVSFPPVVVFYLLYAVGISFFVVAPGIKYGWSMTHVFMAGLFLGLIAYGAYDLTNQATLKDWPYMVTIVDMAWGAMVTGLTAVIAFSLYNYFK